MIQLRKLKRAHQRGELSASEFEEAKVNLLSSRGVVVNAVLAPSLPPPPPELGDYRVLEQIGETPIAIIYRARHHHQTIAQRQGGYVDLELIRPEILQRPDRRYAIEAALDARNGVSVDGLQSLYGVERHGQHVALIKHQRTGRPLSSMIGKRGSPIPWRQAKTVFLSILDTLLYIHAFGVGHGQLSSDSILVDEEGRVMILDFWTAPIQDDFMTLDANALFPLLIEMLMGPDCSFEPEQLHAVLSRNSSVPACVCSALVISQKQPLSLSDFRLRLTAGSNLCQNLAVEELKRQLEWPNLQALWSASESHERVWAVLQDLISRLPDIGDAINRPELHSKWAETISLRITRLGSKDPMVKGLAWLEECLLPLIQPFAGLYSMLLNVADSHGQAMANSMEDLIWGELSRACDALDWFSFSEIKPGQSVDATDVRISGDPQQGSVRIVGLLEFGLLSDRYPSLGQKALTVVRTVP